jgi:hypothetical protein
MILDYFSKVNIGLGIIVLICFFLPWVNAGCGSVMIVKLSGYDLLTGHIALDEDAMQQLSAEAARAGRTVGTLEGEHQTRPQFYLIVIVVCALAMIGYSVRMVQELNRIGIFAIGAFGALAILLLMFSASRDFGADLPPDVARIVHIGRGSGFYVTMAALLSSVTLSVIALRGTSDSPEKIVTIDLPIPQTPALQEEIESLDVAETSPEVHATNAFGEPMKTFAPGAAVSSTVEQTTQCPLCGTSVKKSQTICEQCGNILSGTV